MITLLKGQRDAREADDTGGGIKDGEENMAKGR